MFINGDNLSYTGEIIYLEYFKRFYIMGCIENSIEDIKKVKGIGDSKFSQIKDLITN